MKKRSSRSKSARKSSRKVNVRAKKGFFHKLFPLKFTLISVTVLGCLAIILGGTYRLLPQSDVLGANIGMPKGNIQDINVVITAPNSTNVVPSGDLLRLDVSVLQSISNQKPILTSTYIYPPVSSKIQITLQNGYYYKFDGYIIDKRSNKVSGYAVAMNFPASKFAVGVKGVNIPCGVVNSCSVTISKIDSSPKPTAACSYSYYTQLDKCSTPPLGGTTAGNIKGHKYLIQKCTTGSKASYQCIADCTKTPTAAHCR